MSTDVVRAVAVGLGFVALLGTGYALRRAGKPYGSFLLTVHKLISVALLGFIVWSAVAASGAGGLTPIAWVTVSLSVLTVVILLGTGGALSAVASPPGVVRWLHRVVPYAAIPLTGLWLYLR